MNENTNTQQIHQFWREMEMLSELRHDRIANLRAVVIQPQLRAMIFEYTDLGDLKNYLLARNPSTDIPSHAGPLTLEQQIDICHQVKSTHMYMYYFKALRVSKGYKIDGYACVISQQVLDW